ncbi:MAG: hypothetical protein ABEJ71_00395, partial [Halodesulfurarchaeum sp.]
IQGSPAGADLPAFSFDAAELAAMRERYYEIRGWTEEGIDVETFERLGLEDLGEDQDVASERRATDDRSATRERSDV